MASPFKTVSAVHGLEVIVEIFQTNLEGGFIALGSAGADSRGARAPCPPPPRSSEGGAPERLLFSKKKIAKLLKFNK